MTSRQQQQQPTVSVKPSVWSPIYQVRRLSSKFLSKEAVHNPAFRNVRNPYAYTIWQAIRVRDTIIPTIAPVLCAVLVESVVVAVVFLVYKVPINLDDRMISMMGSAIAMLLAFRTNRSFERYNQGSQLWTNLTNQIRHSARLIWTTITPTTEDGKQEKLKIMKLLLATAVATKHALRGVDPYHFKDLNQLLPEDFVTQGKLSPRLRRRDSVLFKEGVASSLDEMFGSGGIGLSPTNTSNRNSSSSRNTEKLKAVPPLPSKINNNATTTSPTTTTATTVKFTNNQDTDNETPTLSNRRHSIATPTMLRVHSRLTSETPSTASSSSRSYSRITLTSNNNNSPTLPLPPSLHARKCIGNVINVPLDILHHINHYVRTQRNLPLSTLTPEDATPTLTAISTAIDSVTKFEQILYFPVPTTYEIHIKQVLLLYFILLPFQLVKPMGWAMVVATFVMSVTFFGVDAIAGEISDPFGTDENDLPLDYFCVKLKDDLEYIMDGQFDVGGGWVGSGSEAEEEEEGEGEVEYRFGKKRIISVCGNGGSSSGGGGGVHGSSIETAHEVGDRSNNNRGTPMQLRKRK
ncbi:Bestrophin, RFP-TM, chloride channel-domain-containing protein [Obelidium mucronatum]|nr:Bestrophin, RFP-TM, chloride channel-domain-containing protein [Obelidium mucronatum]